MISTYVEAFSILGMGHPIFDPSIDYSLGDIGLTYKLYNHNVAIPPLDVHGCPPAVTLVKGARQYNRIQAIHVSLSFFFLFYWGMVSHFSRIRIVEAEFDKGIFLLFKYVSGRSKFRKSS
jgi:hypothetical protein